MYVEIYSLTNYDKLPLINHRQTRPTDRKFQGEDYLLKAGQSIFSWHLDRFSRFCTGPTDRQTDITTDSPIYASALADQCVRLEIIFTYLQWLADITLFTNKTFFCGCSYCTETILKCTPEKCIDLTPQTQITYRNLESTSASKIEGV